MLSCYDSDSTVHWVVFTTGSASPGIVTINITSIVVVLPFFLDRKIKILISVGLGLY